MGYRIGIDAGSKTNKVVVIDERGEVVRWTYRRHLANIRSTLSHVLCEMVEDGGDACGSVAFTGSAGLALAQALGAPYVQEVVATTRAVRATLPEADAIIELGGEDAKVVYLTGALEQRMNATCAGGTGGFIDTLAGMLGVRASDMNRLASHAKRTYPIASRCAVFAQTDVRPLLNAGADPHDVAASVLDAVVQQTLGGLACGRPLRGTVVFLGGPLEHIPALVDRFRRALDLDEHAGIKPYLAHLYTARGAALSPETESGLRTSLSALADAVSALDLPDDDLPRLAPLFDDARAIRMFRARHAALRWPRVSLARCSGPLFLGIDAGSTTVKFVLTDAQGRLAWSEYRPVRGDVLMMASAMLARVWQQLPKRCFIARAAVTGYGEALLRAGFGVDDGVVETVAHARAACALRPDVTFLLDIGGQDMKALWLRDGRVIDAVLNEACSSGCGAFLEGTAYALGSTPDVLASLALEASQPVDLGTKCTVFMTSRVRHAQKTGAALADLGAGLALSVVRNALYRIVGAHRAAQLGSCVMVQGGAFKSDAVLRAFELVSGREVLRPDVAHLMGALGAALVAADRWRAGGGSGAGADAEPLAEAAGEGEGAADRVRACVAGQAASLRSTLVGAEELRRLVPTRVQRTCTGCGNACVLTVVDFGNGRSSVSGNRCARGAGADARRGRRPPNVVKLQQGLIARLRTTAGGARGLRVGLMTAMAGFESLSFFHTFFRALGFAVVVPAGVPCGDDAAAWESIPSESVCHPAKQAHFRLLELVRSGADVVFVPRYRRGSRCTVMCSYADVLADALETMREDGEASAGVRLVSPLLASVRIDVLAQSAEDRAALRTCAEELCGGVGTLTDEAFSRAFDAALRAQQAFEETVGRATRHALAWVEADPRRRGAVLACRPYHVDPAVLHGIDEELTRLGYAVLAPLGLYVAGSAVGESARSAAAAASWGPAKRLVRLAAQAAAHSQLDAVILRSFGCTMDAVAIGEARAVLEAARKHATVLKIDDIVDTAHIGIRLRTLAEANAVSGGVPRELEADALQEGGSREGVAPAGGTRSDVAQSPRAARASSRERRTVDVLATPIDYVDVEIARRETPSDLCFTAAVLAARAIRAVRASGADAAGVWLQVPAVCERCVLDALPSIVARACGVALDIVWTRTWPQGSASCHDAGYPADAAVCPANAERAPALPAPRVGLVGNALLCFDPFMNGGAADVLRAAGCTPVLPDPAALCVDDVRYLDQLQAWYDDGVRDVVYLQSFGCVKGHVQARGARRSLERRFPGMRITVIDCDPEASSLNRENRLRLAAEAAREAYGVQKDDGTLAQAHEARKMQSTDGALKQAREAHGTPPGDVAQRQPQAHAGLGRDASAPAPSCEIMESES